ncbi:MAG: zinc-ribbon domain-containing protein [Pyrinomonadaceae bacterium]
MFCPNCGNQIAENLKFCRNCGLKLGKVSQILADEKLQNQEINIFANRKLFEKLGFISLFCFLGMGFGYVF